MKIICEDVLSGEDNNTINCSIFALEACDGSTSNRTCERVISNKTKFCKNVNRNFVCDSILSFQ